MSRSGYSDDWEDHWSTIRWRGAVTQATRGKRGQAFLRDMLAILDAMPDKRLVAGDWVREDGCACALGVMIQARRPDLAEAAKTWDPDDDCVPLTVAGELGIAQALAREIVWINDEYASWRLARGPDADEVRWRFVRQWVAEHIVKEQPVAAE